MSIAHEPSVRDLTPAEGFGGLLRAWRLARGLSQEALSSVAGVSQRHLSFLEKARAAPTRAMVITLSRALDIPLRERNTLLMAAGYAGAYRAEPLDAPAMAPIEAAIEHALEAHDPLPALVIDVHWNVLRGNRGVQRIFGHYLGPDYLPSLAAKGPPNLIEMMCAQDGMRRVVANWADMIRALRERLVHEALGGIPDRRTGALIALIEARLADWGSPEPARAPATPLPFIDLVLSDGKTETRWFTAVMAFGSPVDVTLQELRLEFMYPVDATTRAFAERLAIDA